MHDMCTDVCHCRWIHFTCLSEHYFCHMSYIGKVLTCYDTSMQRSAACYSNCYTTTTWSRNTWDTAKLQAVWRQVFSQPGASGSHLALRYVRPHTQTHIVTVCRHTHTLPGNVTVWDPRSQLSDRAALQHTHTNTVTEETASAQVELVQSGTK